MTTQALDLWKAIYPDLSQEHTGLAGGIINRAEAQTLRLALIYALLDGQGHIAETHLHAALAMKTDFILYAGRKEAGKNVPLLIDFFARYKKHRKNELKLVLIGSGTIEIPSENRSDIIDLGFVPLQDKYDAYAAATFLCQPSLNESFSIVIMESWLCKSPVLVHAKC